MTAKKMEQPIDQSTKADSEMCIPQASPIATGMRLITTNNKDSCRVMPGPREGFFLFLRH
jgi:hypothetical protein